MEIATEIRGESPAEFFDESEGEILGIRGIGWRIEFQLWAIAEIDDGAAERFVHGDVGVAVASDAGFVAKGFTKALADDDTGILHGVVEIDVDITIDLDFEVDE